MKVVMTTKQTSESNGAALRLNNVSWLEQDDVVEIVTSLVAAGEEVRVVGGAVRNAILGEEVFEIDFATTARPKQMIEIFGGSSSFDAYPLGLEYGTVQLKKENQVFELTTLREDVRTDGRHAEVEFGTDWVKDSQRRDFTMNALYADSEGNVYDFHGGIDDCQNRVLKFIGSAERRIQEDYLRILRYFRFLSTYASHGLEERIKSVVLNNLSGLERLSPERIRYELLKMFTALNPTAVIRSMETIGLFEVLLGESTDIDQFGNLVKINDGDEFSRDPILRLFALTGFDGEVFGRLSSRLRLSKDEVSRMTKAHAVTKEFSGVPTDFDVSRSLFRHGPGATIDGCMINWSRETGGERNDEWQQILNRVHSLDIPKFPISGKDLIARGFKPGSELGAKLRLGEEIWIASEFKMKPNDILDQITS